MSNSISFEQYLVKNEEWLLIGNEKKGEHYCDNKLDNDEISAFFSASHIEVNSSNPGDGKLSMDEFNNWYDANSEAIEAYYNYLGVEFNDESKKSMLDSMLNFIEDHFTVTAKAHENNPQLGELKTYELGISDKKAAEYAEQLKNSVGTIPFMNVMNNDDLTNSAWLKIMQHYNTDGDSLIHDIDHNYQFRPQNANYQKKIAEILIEEAGNGNSSAIQLLCTEFYNATAAHLGTADSFVDYIFENASNKVLSALYNNYSVYNSNRSIENDIKNEYHLFNKSTGTRYYQQLIDALGGSFTGNRTS